MIKLERLNSVSVMTSNVGSTHMTPREDYVRLSDARTYGDQRAAEARELMREECLLLITQSAKQYNREANGGDNSGASDHKQDACELLANEIKELP